MSELRENGSRHYDGRGTGRVNEKILSVEFRVYLTWAPSGEPLLCMPSTIIDVGALAGAPLTCVTGTSTSPEFFLQPRDGACSRGNQPQLETS